MENVYDFLMIGYVGNGDLPMKELYDLYPTLYPLLNDEDAFMSSYLECSIEGREKH